VLLVVPARSMKSNYELSLAGGRCILVPYRPEHLPNYHRWMQDPFLLDATASEPLSMEEEITMQKEWRDDEHKCTFIILARDVLHGQCPDVPPCPCDNSSNERSSFPKLVEQTLQCMIGDINLFLSEEEEEEIDEEESFRRQQHLQNITQQVEMEPPELTQAELDLMIAESSHRRKNLGTELALMMMHYGASQLNIKRFFVKVKDNNHFSLRLFKEKLGFEECAYAECFGEYELEVKKKSSQAMVDWIETKWSEKSEGQAGKLYEIHDVPL